MSVKQEVLLKAQAEFNAAMAEAWRKTAANLVNATIHDEIVRSRDTQLRVIKQHIEIMNLKKQLREIAEAAGHNENILLDESCNALAESVKTLRDNYVLLYTELEKHK